MILSNTHEDAARTERLKDTIRRLAAERNAIVLAHYYQEAPIQDVADFVGDSLELARKAAETDADTIVFCGVHFMAETAKILNPGKKVLLPDLEAGCSLAEAAPAYAFKRFRELNPEHLAVTYINCTADVKALSDIICTSSSAERILSLIPRETPVLFAPDRNLGRYLERKTGRRMLLWQGACVVHEQFSVRRLLALVFEHPDAVVLAHPECEEALLDHAGFIGSTSALLRYARESSAAKFIVATEPGILHQMQKACPDKSFIPAPPEGICPCSECHYMRLNTLEKVAECMQSQSPEITLSEDLRQRALVPINRMLKMSSGDDAAGIAALAGIALPFGSNSLD